MIRGLLVYLACLMIVLIGSFALFEIGARSEEP